MAVRGIRNNNPGNIDRDATKWQGMADDQSSDPRFVVFKSPLYGIRALAVTLLAYQTKHGLNTLRGIAGRWAPPSENNTPAYVAALSAATGFGPDQALELENAATMTAVVKAIIAHEDAGYAYPDATVAEGVRLAGVADAPAPKLHQQPAFVAQAGSGAALAVAGCMKACESLAQNAGQHASTVKSLADGLGDFAAAPIVQHAVVILLTVGAGLKIVGYVADWLKTRTT